MATKLEIYDGANWVTIPTGNVLGTSSQIQVTQDASSNNIVGFATNPSIPGNVTVGTDASSTLTVNGNMALTGTGSLTIPVGTTVQRPAVPIAGMIRLNTQLTMSAPNPMDRLNHR